MMAFAPMPPRRPNDISITSGPVVAYAPIPPVRPSALAQSNPIPIANVPELRGLTNVVASLESIDHPLPPRRPTASVAVASASSFDIPTTGSTAAARIVPRDEKPKLAQPVLSVKAPEPVREKTAPALARALMTAGPQPRYGFLVETHGRSRHKPLHRACGQAAAGCSLDRTEKPKFDATTCVVYFIKNAITVTKAKPIALAMIIGVLGGAIGTSGA